MEESWRHNDPNVERGNLIRENKALKAEIEGLKNNERILNEGMRSSTDNLGKIAMDLRDERDGYKGALQAIDSLGPATPIKLALEIANNALEGWKKE